MKLPDNQYTLETFVEYIVSNIEEVFEGRKERKTLKAYLLYVAKDWKAIFSGLKSVALGDIIRISFEGYGGNENDEPFTDFYIYQWVPGLIVMFTSSTKEEYEKTLKNFISYTRGITESWIRPSLLDQIKNYLIENYDARVYRFIARRYRYWKYPARIRPEYDRRMNYTSGAIMGLKR